MMRKIFIGSVLGLVMALSATAEVKADANDKFGVYEIRSSRGMSNDELLGNAINQGFLPSNAQIMRDSVGATFVLVPSPNNRTFSNLIQAGFRVGEEAYISTETEITNKKDGLMVMVSGNKNRDLFIDKLPVGAKVVGRGSSATLIEVTDRSEDSVNKIYRNARDLGLIELGKFHFDANPAVLVQLKSAGRGTVADLIKWGKTQGFVPSDAVLMKNDYLYVPAGKANLLKQLDSAGLETGVTVNLASPRAFELAKSTRFMVLTRMGHDRADTFFERIAEVEAWAPVAFGSDTVVLQIPEGAKGDKIYNQIYQEANDVGIILHSETGKLRTQSPKGIRCEAVFL